MNHQHNRRRSFRLDDSLQLSVRELSTHEAEAISQDFDHYRLRLCLKSHFVNQRQAMLPGMQVLKKRDADVAAYLEHLEQQIIQLADQLSSALNTECGAQMRRYDVNLSADGIRFDYERILSTGQVVELGMFLPSNATQIVVLARVVRSDGLSVDRCAVSLEYIRIHEEDVEAIIRHMARLQQAQLQSRRAS